MPTAFVSHHACEDHLAGTPHPDTSSRLSAIHDRLVTEGISDFLVHVEAPRARPDELERIHTAAHIREVLHRQPDESGVVWLDHDTILDVGTPEAAQRAAGAVIRATALVLSGEINNAFCCVRPPGHHATRTQAMGFCFFNNVAAGVAHALEVGRLQKVAIVDFDAHHGNGTEEIFRDDSRVLFCSAYQRGLFPEPEPMATPDRAIHLGLEPGAKGTAFRQGVQALWEPALNQFQPEMLFVSAGFDAHASDSMSDLLLGDDDFRWISEWLVGIADRHARGRLVSTLEGGYELRSLSRCAAIHVRALLGI